MFDEAEKYDQTIEEKKYDKSIIHAINAHKYGNHWLKLNHSEEYDRIGKTYSNLFLAYRNYGDTLFNVNDFEKALINYYKADSLYNKSHYNTYLNDYDKELSYWNKSRIAEAYISLYEHDKTDSIYNYLIDNYSKVKDTIDDDYLNSKLAFLESEFYNYDKVKELTNNVLIELNYYNKITPSDLVIHNNLANANTQLNSVLSDSLYKVTINVSKKNKKENSLPFSNALNGLGVLVLNNGKYKKADSLFNQSLIIEDKLFNKQTVNKLITLTNLLESKANQRQAKLFNQYYNNTIEIISELNLNETIYEAKVYNIKGDFLKNNQSLGFYKKALAIYQAVFNENHPKITYLKSKIKRS